MSETSLVLIQFVTLSSLFCISSSMSSTGVNKVLVELGFDVGKHCPRLRPFPSSTILRPAFGLRRRQLLTMQASDRFNINSQLEHLQAKYVGTGHADVNRFEWAVNIQRDSYASYIGHAPLLAFFAVAENESIGRVRYNFMQRMLLPCGKPPDRDQED